MRREKKIVSLVLIIAMVSVTIGLSGCVEEAENKIVVGTSADFPPFEYMSADQEIVGFDIDMITIILTGQGYTVEVSDMAFDSLIPSLLTNKIDVIVAGMTITEDRLEQVSFSDPYYEADQSVLIKSGANITIENVSDMANLTVGAQTGTTGAIWVQEALIDTNMTPADMFESYETYDLALWDLKNERIDILVIDKPVAQAYAEDGTIEIVYTIMTEEHYAIAVRKEDTELLEKINEGLAELKASDEWDELIQRYFE